MSKTIKRLILFLAVFAGAAVLVVYVRAQYVLPIAMYHSVQETSPEGNRLVVSVKVFERQMAFLKKHGYNVISLDEAAQGIASKRRFPPRTVVITFDDGNADNFTHAFPVLKKYGIPATIFLISDDIGKPGKLTLDQIRQMQGSGLVSFGSHTISHPFLEFVKDSRELVRQIKGSKLALEEALDRPVTTFSYPCGRLNAEVRQTVIDAGYKTAVVTNPGKACPNKDVFALKRLRISENAGNLFVFWVEISGYYNFIRENRHK